MLEGWWTFQVQSPQLYHHIARFDQHVISVPARRGEAVKRECEGDTRRATESRREREREREREPWRKKERGVELQGAAGYLHPDDARDL